jgi:hypothetical protein
MNVNMSYLLESLHLQELDKAMAAGKATNTTPTAKLSTERPTSSTKTTSAAVKPAYDSYYESCEYKQKMKTTSLKALHNLAARKSPRGDVVMINIEEEVMGVADIAVLDPKQLMEFVDLDNLDAVHILIWMK